MTTKLKNYFPMIRERKEVLELEDGSIANLEVQKIGYLFPGQRSACHSADLLLRQYRRIRNETDASSGETEDSAFSADPQEENAAKKKKFNCHFFEQKSDTGLKLELLQKYLFIPLDIFLKNKQKLYELDRNTVEYMIDEMQEIIDNQNQTINNLESTINQLKSTQEQAIRNAVIILKGLNLSDSEIITRICSQYQFDKKEILKYI